MGGINKCVGIPSYSILDLAIELVFHVTFIFYVYMLICLIYMSGVKGYHHHHHRRHRHHHRHQGGSHHVQICHRLKVSE